LKEFGAFLDGQSEGVHGIFIAVGEQLGAVSWYVFIDAMIADFETFGTGQKKPTLKAVKLGCSGVQTKHSTAGHDALKPLVLPCSLT
jgi:hypothetical protein